MWSFTSIPPVRADVAISINEWYAKAEEHQDWKGVEHDKVIPSLQNYTANFWDRKWEKVTLQKKKKKGIAVSGGLQRVSTSVTRTSSLNYFPAKSFSEEVAAWGLYEAFSIWDKLN